MSHVTITNPLSFESLLLKKLSWLFFWPFSTLDGLCDWDYYEYLYFSPHLNDTLFIYYRHKVKHILIQIVLQGFR